MGLFDETDMAKKKEEEKKKSKKMLILIGVGIFILFVALVVVMYFMINPPGEPELSFKFNKTVATANNTYKNINKYIKVNEENKTIESFSIRDMASYFGYEEHLGSYYNSYDESINTECYIVKPGVEVTMFKSGSSKIVKHSLLADIPDQTYELEGMVREDQKNFYINQEGFELAFNCRATYDTNQNRITINSLEHIVEIYKTDYKCYLLIAPGENKEQDTKKNNITYTQYCYQKALLNGYFVIKDSSSELLGLVKLSDLDKNLAPLAGAEKIDISLGNILTLKANYKEIEFNETTGFFTVTTKNGDMGIYNGDGKKIIEPSYKSIIEITKIGKNYLYVVKNSDNKFGIVNSNDKVVIKVMYDQIGIDSEMDDSNVKNRYILYDTYIPAKIDGKWKFFSLSGDPELENIQFMELLQGGITNIGCKVANSTKEKSTIVLVPYEDIDGIIVEYNDKDPTTNKVSKKYAVLGTARLQIEASNAISAYKKIDRASGDEIYMLVGSEGEKNLADYIRFDNDDNEGEDDVEIDESEEIKEESDND